MNGYMEDVTYKTLNAEKARLAFRSSKNEERYKTCLGLFAIGSFVSYGSLVFNVGLPITLASGMAVAAGSMAGVAATFVLDVKYSKEIKKINLKINDCVTGDDNVISDSFSDDLFIDSSSNVKVKRIGARR